MCPRLWVGVLLAAMLLVPEIGYTRGRREHLDDEFHIHADLLVVVDGDIIDLSAARYQSDDLRQLSPDLHLHNGEGDVVHIHAPRRTLTQFIDSLDAPLNGQYDQATILVNGRPTAADYVMADGDRILIVYGDATAEHISAFMDMVTDRACIYSATCPERGSPPSEGCGSAEEGCPLPWAEEQEQHDDG